MSQCLLDYLPADTLESLGSAESARMSYGLILSCRQAILEGKYDCDDQIALMLDRCMDRIIQDLR